ncbi:MAG TPA: glucosidase, partial [Gemmataceae bacterium]|nr:glucosidase [Gemmataceae bacterium]
MNQEWQRDTEARRLEEDARRERNWKRWGPYLSERQWATVREDYSADNANWTSFPYEHSLARAYRWGEDGLLGVTDRECRLCLAVALWNGTDPHLKERLFGLTNPEGNHAEDVKEVYFYLDATPTHSYLKALYKYPQRAFPYQELRDEARRRTRTDPEFEVTDTDAFDGGQYWDVSAEYAKAAPDDLLVRITVANRGPGPARLHLLPTLWFRNTWSWGARYDEGKWAKPRLARLDSGLLADHQTLGRFRLAADPPPAEWVFTENETNPRVFGPPAGSGYYKDAFHRYVVGGEKSAVAWDAGTKAAAVYVLDVPAGAEAVVRLRLTAEGEAKPDPFAEFEAVLADRRHEADEFYAAVLPAGASDEQRRVSRQAYAGLLWSEQFYHYVVPDWVDGDAGHPNPPEVRDNRINRDWPHLFSRDVLSVPDKWEYPAFFAWDLAFHMVPMARIDPDFAKRQLLLLLREWYLHPSGQLPAFEYDLSNVNPPVHAWACWQVYRADGKRDLAFLERAFQKLLMNFTWWVNRKDPHGRNVFAGGFLGMDNLGVFDRSRPLPIGQGLEQADGTAWMGFYCTQMLEIALELALHNRAYEDVASKFFEHFVHIADALNNIGGRGLWDEADGFYYDQLLFDGRSVPLKLRGMMGVIPLLAVHILDERVIHPNLPEFEKRLRWFRDNRRDLLKHVSALEVRGEVGGRQLLLALPTRDRLARVLGYLLDEREFLSPFGVRSLSRVYAADPYTFEAGGRAFSVRYVPADMDTADFGGNSNWRGPVWMPVNFLLVEALRKYHAFFSDSFTVECPTGSGRRVTLDGAADELGRRLAALFLPVGGRPRPCHGSLGRFAEDPHWRDHVLF